MSNISIGKTIATGFDRRILCIGDVMLDIFETGPVDRLSPEAPVPVLLNPERRYFAGGAANLALNLHALGAKVHLIGVTGDDAAAETLKQHISCAADIVVDPDRPTSVKHRIVASGTQLVRLDHEVQTPLSPAMADAVLGYVETQIIQSDMIVLSDYGKGTLSPNVLRKIRSLADNHSVPVLCDPYIPNIDHYGRLLALKPNQKEAERLTGIEIVDDAAAEEAIGKILERVDTEFVCLTRGADGLSLGQRGKRTWHYRASPREVFDVVGAGDTALAGFAMGMVGTQRPDCAAKLSLCVSGLSVEHAGTRVVGIDEVLAETAPAGRPQSLSQLRSKLMDWSDRGDIIGFTNGCFDVLHPGHIEVLRQAAASCDRLIVAINGDASVRRLKGAARPHHSLEVRIGKLQSLGLADAIIAFNEDTPAKLIAAVKPDRLIKGADYSVDEIVGSDVVLAEGGEVICVPLLEGFSSTSILNARN